MKSRFTYFMYGPEAFDRGYRDLPDKSDDALRTRRRAHHIRTQPIKQKLPSPGTDDQELALRTIAIGDLELAEACLNTDSEELNEARGRSRANIDRLNTSEAVNIAYRLRIHQLRTLPTWRIYPEIAAQFRHRAEIKERHYCVRFWGWPPLGTR
jgi:hypothetical protein